MDNNETKRELLKFLDNKVFDPVLNAHEKDYQAGENQKKFEKAKKSIEEEKQRFHNLNTAEDIKQHFEENLNSGPAQKVYSDLKTLNLPRLPQYEDEFHELYNSLKNK